MESDHLTLVIECISNKYEDIRDKKEQREEVKGKIEDTQKWTGEKLLDIDFTIPASQHNFIDGIVDSIHRYLKDLKIAD